MKSVADPGEGADGATPTPGRIKISHKKHGRRR